MAREAINNREDLRKRYIKLIEAEAILLDVYELIACDLTMEEVQEVRKNVKEVITLLGYYKHREIGIITKDNTEVNSGTNKVIAASEKKTDVSKEINEIVNNNEQVQEVAQEIAKVLLKKNAVGYLKSSTQQKSRNGRAV